MHLANPQYLWLFLIYIPLIVWYVLHQKNYNAPLAISTLSAFSAKSTSWRGVMRHLLFVMRLGAIGCLIIILCRPQDHDSWHSSSIEGTDIMLAIDVSGSMWAKDFTPDRLEASKKMASEFVAERDNDNIGLVIFAGESLTGLPMTTDHAALINYIEGVQVGMLEDGTAIGDGIVTSINRIKNGRAKSKSIILLTDGSNNTGIVAPLSAAEVAKKNNIKIYTIGIGTNGTAPYPVSLDALGRPVFQQQKVVIDENTLQGIAKLTGGKYFRATDNNSLQSIFKEIDALEKTKMDVNNFSRTEDDYMLWAWLLLGIVCLELTLRYTVLRTIP